MESWLSFCFICYRIFSFFPRNLAPDFLQYACERPEMSSKTSGPRKAKTKKGKSKLYEKANLQSHCSAARLLCAYAGSPSRPSGSNIQRQRCQYTQRQRGQHAE